MKSQFDKHERSTTNGLPIEMDLFDFIRFTAESAPTLVLTRVSIKDAIVEEFKIPAIIADANGPGSDTSVLSTIVSFLMSDALYAVRKTATPFLKRVGPGEFQHVSGPLRPYMRTMDGVKVSKKAVGEAMVSVKILKELGWEPARIMLELNTWSDDVIEVAIDRCFSLTSEK